MNKSWRLLLMIALARKNVLNKEQNRRLLDCLETREPYQGLIVDRLKIQDAEIMNDFAQIDNLRANVTSLLNSHFKNRDIKKAAVDEWLETLQGDMKPELVKAMIELVDVDEGDSMIFLEDFDLFSKRFYEDNDHL